MRGPRTHSPWKLFEYDSIRRRLWIFGQRCHHGATGSLVAAVGCMGLIAETSLAVKPLAETKTMAMLALTGGALMAHDWKDRSIWFERGRGTQP